MGSQQYNSYGKELFKSYKREKTILHTFFCNVLTATGFIGSTSAFVGPFFLVGPPQVERKWIDSCTITIVFVVLYNRFSHCYLAPRKSTLLTLIMIH